MRATLKVLGTCGRRLLLLAVVVWLVIAMFAETGTHLFVDRAVRGALIQVVILGLFVSGSIEQLRASRIRITFLAAASRRSRFEPAAYMARLHRCHDPADPELGLWKRDVTPRVGSLGHLLSALPLVQWILAAILIAPNVLMFLSFALGGRTAFMLTDVLMGSIAASLLAVTLILAFGRDALRWRVESRIRARVCAHCAYDLRGLGSENESPSQPGPERCPECACMWPLIPPPGPRM